MKLQANPMYNQIMNKQNLTTAKKYNLVEYNR